MNSKIAVLKRAILALALLGMSVTFFGCHTVHGAGQDIEQAGRTIERHTP